MDTQGFLTPLCDTAMDTRYRPPEAALQIESVGGRTKVKALVVGLVLSVCGSALLEPVVTLIFSSLWLNMAATLQEQVPLLDRVAPFASLFAGITVVGLAASVLGGYSCSCIAKARCNRLGLLLTCLAVATSELLAESGRMAAVSLILAALTTGSVLLGTAVGLQRSHP